MTADAFTFVVMGPPVPKARARVVQRGTKRVAITPEKTAAYERLVGLHALAARPRGWSLEGEFMVEIAVYRADRRADLDNIVKAATDAMNRIAYHDDRQITKLVAESFDRHPAPHLRITVGHRGTE